MFLPNHLTVARIFLTPLFGLCLVKNNPFALSLACAIVVAAFVSDLLDGYWARKMNLTSSFGICFDPIADKIFILGAFVALLANGEISLSLTALILIVVRELSVTGLRIAVLVQSAKLLPSEHYGKMKTVAQFVWLLAAVCVLLLSSLGIIVEPWARWMGLLFWVVSLYTVISGLLYIWKNRQALSYCWKS